tara:strand:+ start:4997 stop:5692 length:696 start_codon:yes stop_codon:yes gene_type:complete
MENLNIDTDLLLSKGFVKVPTLTLSDNERKDLLYNILNSKSNKIYLEMTDAHKQFLDMKNINKSLTPFLSNLAKKMGFLVNDKDIYCVTRVVNPNDPHESFKAHFDSHLFTLVTPIRIPRNENCDEGNGELIAFPKLRSEPKLELFNIMQKAFYKLFANERGINYLSRNKDNYIFNFKDNNPVLFLGRTTLHFNLPVENKNGDKRVTLLTHFFDPSPKIGIGSILRKLRRR